MQKLKICIANTLWRIAGISPKMGNLVMDLLGYERYCKLAKIQTLHKRQPA